MRQVFISGIYTAASNNNYNGVTGGASWSALAFRQQVIPCWGVLSNLRVDTDRAPSAGLAYNVTLFQNGLATSLMATVADSSTVGADLTHVVTVNAGDSLAIKMSFTGVPSTPIIRWAMAFDTTAPAMSVVMSNQCGTISSEFWLPLIGQKITSTGDARPYRIPSPTSGTLKTMYVKTNIDSTPGSYAVVLQKNHVDTACICNITPGITSVSNLVNTVDIVPNDLLSFHITPSGSPTPAAFFVGMVLESSYPGEFLCGSAIVNGPTDTTNPAYYTVFNGGSATGWTQYAGERLGETLACTFSKLYAVVSTPPGATKSWAFDLRINGNNYLPTTISGTSSIAGNITDSIYVFAGSLLEVVTRPDNSPAVSSRGWACVGVGGLTVSSIFSEVIACSGTTSRSGQYRRTPQDTVNMGGITNKKTSRTFSDYFNTSGQFPTYFPIPFYTNPLTDMSYNWTTSVGGQYYETSLTATFTLADGFNRVTILHETYNDSLMLTDTFSKGYNASRQLTDYFTINDTRAKTGIFNRGFTDSMQLSDSKSNLFAFNRVFTEVTTISSDFNRRVAFQKILADSASLSDLNANAIRITRVFNDPFILSDSRNAGLSRTLTNYMTLSDQRQQQSARERILTDTLTESDTFRKFFGRTLPDSFTLYDSLGQPSNYARTLTDSFTLADIRSKGMNRTLANAMTLNDIYQRQLIISKTFTETFNEYDVKELAGGDIIDLNAMAFLSDTISFHKIMSLLLPESITIYDDRASAVKYVRTWGDPFTMPDTRSQDISRTLSNSMTVSDQRQQLLNIQRTFNETFSMFDYLQKFHGRLLSDSFNVYDTGTPVVKYTRIFTDPFTLYDTSQSQRYFTRQLTDNVTMGGLYDRGIRLERTFAGTLGLNGIPLHGNMQYPLFIPQGFQLSDSIMVGLPFQPRIHVWLLFGRYGFATIGFS
jgi:hypothetical protein